MKLTKGLKFIQDNSVFCEVLNIYKKKTKTKKGFRYTEVVDIKKNNKVTIYELACFQKSFENGLIFGSFKLQK